MPNIHAIVPAAGHSRRMGQPKLLMEIDGENLVERLLRQLRQSTIASVSVLVRASDQALQDEVSKHGTEVVIPEHDPNEMRDSVELLLEHLRQAKSPAENDGWLLIPADHPIVEPQVLNRLTTAWLQSPEKIVVPIHQGRRGHPTIFPWTLASQLEQIPPDQGLNWLLRNGETQIEEVECDEPSVLWDIDTPEEFARIREILED